MIVVRIFGFLLVAISGLVLWIIFEKYHQTRVYLAIEHGIRDSFKRERNRVPMLVDKLAFSLREVRSHCAYHRHSGLHCGVLLFDYAFEN